MSASINFPGQYQILSEWCWLTCASGVINFYMGANNALPYSQCKLAVQQKLGNSACSQTINGSAQDISSWVPLISAPGGHALHYDSSNANQPGDPTFALNGSGKVTGTWGQPTHDVDWMMGELGNGNPVIGHISLNPSGGHIVVFYGASKSGNDAHYNVADPWVGDTVWINGQIQGGSWDNSAITRNGS